MATPACVPIRDDTHVTDLATNPIPAANQLIINHQGATKARPDSQHQHVCSFTSGPKTVLSPPGSIGIVFHHNRDLCSQQCTDFVRNRVVTPHDVGGKLN